MNIITKAVCSAGVIGMALVGVSACGGGHGGTGIGVAPTHITTSSTYPLCTDIYGMPTLRVINEPCTQADGSLEVDGYSDLIVDAGHIYWSDSGWGLEDGTWQKHDRADGQLIPPDSYLKFTIGN